MTWQRKKQIFEKSYDEVLIALKHQDDKLNRTLTAIAFLTAAGVAIYAIVASGQAVKFDGSDLDAVAVFFVIFLVSVLLALLVALSAIGPSDALPPRKSSPLPKWPSLLYWAQILKQDDWEKRIDNDPAALEESLARNLHEEARVLANRVNYKVARSRESGAFVQVAVLSLVLLGIFSTTRLSIDARWWVASVILVLVLALPLWDFAQMRALQLSRRAGRRRRIRARRICRRVDRGVAVQRRRSRQSLVGRLLCNGRDPRDTSRIREPNNGASSSPCGGPGRPYCCLGSLDFLSAPLATPDGPPWNRRQHSGGTPTAARTSYEIDRDRIIHSETFRDLQYKTQVQSLAGLAADARFRTRLNHSIEVAQLARGIARELHVTEALTEAIALAHDLGHPPFGHAGERALKASLQEHGESGWNANVHSLAVVERVEAMFIAFRGINLTWATREGIARHSTPFDEPESVGEFVTTPQGGVECQIVDAADVLAWLSHDLDDALADGFVNLADIAGLSPLIEEIVLDAEREWEEGKRAWPESERDHLIRRRVVAKLISRSIRDYRDATRERMAERGRESPADVRNTAERVVVASPELATLTASLLEDALIPRYYRSESVQRTDSEAEQTIRGLFKWYVANPAEIPERFFIDGPAVSAATYIASMNDRIAESKARELDLLAPA